jgi:hypothetical protein
MGWILTHGQLNGMYFNLAYTGDREGYGLREEGRGNAPLPRVWIIERVVDTPEGPRLEVWGEKVAEGFIEGWYDEREYSDHMGQWSDDAYEASWVEMRYRGEWLEKPDALAVTGDPRAEAVPSTPHGKPHEFPL